jgi:hypothetical protein
MDDWQITRSSHADWRERNRGLMFALGACMAMWAVALWWLIRP